LFLELLVIGIVEDAPKSVVLLVGNDFDEPQILGEEEMRREILKRERLLEKILLELDAVLFDLSNRVPKLFHKL
jgi:hypothetical protein